ncbi:hypothetical protein D3C73_494850 [compost metagenome]
MRKIRHVVGSGKCFGGALRAVFSIHEIGEGNAAERTLAGIPGFRRIGAFDLHLVIKADEDVLSSLGDRLMHGLAAGMDRIGIVIATERASNVGLARQVQRLRPEGGLQRRIAGAFQKSGNKSRIADHILAVARIAGGLRQVRHGKVGQSLPAREKIAVMAGDMDEVFQRLFEYQIDRCREGPVERHHRPGRDARECEALAALGQMQHVARYFAAGDRCRFGNRTIVENQREGEWNMQRLLVRLAGCGRCRLLERQRERAGGSVIGA